MPSLSEPSSDAEVKSVLAEMSSIDLSQEEGRKQMSIHAQAILNAFQNPIVKAFELMFSCTVLPCVRAAVDLNLFQLIAAEAMTAKELAKLTSADDLLITRIARVLVAASVINEDEDGRYSATSISNVFCLESLADGLKHCFDTIYAPCAKLPGQLRETNFASPTNPLNTPFQSAFNTNKHFFEYLAEPSQEPARLASQFNNFMSAYRSAKTPWPSLLPVDEVLCNNAKPGTALLVDVGGGYGHDLALFKQAIPDAHGELYLQELENVVSIPFAKVLAENQAAAGFQVMQHDFFSPQPIEGARCYLLKSVLHDWPDSHALRILENVKVAMEPGYSKILIVEAISPENSNDLSVAAAGVDITMMVQFASLERTSTSWLRLIDQSGLRVENIWTSKDGDGIMCCTL